MDVMSFALGCMSGVIGGFLAVVVLALAFKGGGRK